MRRARHALDWNEIRESRVRIDMAAHDVQEIDHAAGLETPGDLESVLLAQAAVENLVAGVAHADDELGADPPANGRQYVEGEFQAGAERAAVGPFQCVRQRRPELIHEMAV